MLAQSNVGDIKTPEQAQAYLASLSSDKRLSVSRLLSGYSAFRLRYRDDRTAFVRDCFTWGDGEGPADYQEDILGLVDTHVRVAAYGPRGLGKTALMAWVILHFALTWDGEDWKFPVTASVWRQLTHFAFPELQKWSRRINWKKIGRGPFSEGVELMQLSLRLSTGEAFAVASDNAQTLEGAHARAIGMGFDEAKIIPPATFDAIEGSFTGGGDSRTVRVLAVSTPGDINTRFHEICTHKPGYEDWKVRPVTLDECLRAGRVDPTWVEQRKKQWGEQSPLFQNHVMGVFSSAQETGVIPLAWVEAAIERWHEWDEAGRQGTIVAVGADIARYGDDTTVLAPLTSDNVITELRPSVLEDTMQTTGRIVGVLRANHEAVAVVDIVGLGAGVFDRLREQQYNALAFNAGERADETDASGELGFVNVRSAAYWHLREMLDPLSQCRVALPDDPLLIGDLTSPQWKTTSAGKIQLESKDDIRKRLGRSTDYGDAVVQAFWGVRNGGQEPVGAVIQSEQYVIGE